jgi:hypothetical protein
MCVCVWWVLFGVFGVCVLVVFCECAVYEQDKKLSCHGQNPHLSFVMINETHTHTHARLVYIEMNVNQSGAMKTERG